MMKILFLVLVFCCCLLEGTAETDKSHVIKKRAIEEPTELQLENDLKRVKRIIKPQTTLTRTKRTKLQDHLEQELSRIKRQKRSLAEQSLSRMKRENTEKVMASPTLSRVKRFNELKANIATLVRVKRLRRSAMRTMAQFGDHDLLPIRRTKRSVKPMDFAMPTLSRTKRFQTPNNIELSRVKRLKRSAPMMKRIPPDLHKLRNRNSDNMANRGHFNTLKGLYPTHSNTLQERGAHSRNVENFKQRIQNRLRARHRKRQNHRKHKAKKDKHHVQSHRLNKKSFS